MLVPMVEAESKSGLPLDVEHEFDWNEEVRESDEERRERAANRVFTPRCPRCGHELIARPRHHEVRYHCGCSRE